HPVRGETDPAAGDRGLHRAGGAAAGVRVGRRGYRTPGSSWPGLTRPSAMFPRAGKARGRFVSLVHLARIADPRVRPEDDEGRDWGRLRERMGAPPQNERAAPKDRSPVRDPETGSRVR